MLAGATASLAVAIWTMHFVGMLAVRLPFQVDYLVLPTLLSFLVCAIVVGAAVYATSSGPLTLLRLTLSSCLMGGGIFTMHYIGMNALDASTYMIHDRVYVASSMAIAIAASGLALWLATGRGGRPPLILSAIVFGIAVSGMHYTAMARRHALAVRDHLVIGRPGAVESTSSPSSSPSWRSAFPEYFSCCFCPIHPARLRNPPRLPSSGAVTTAVHRNAGGAVDRSRRGRRREPPNSDAAPTRRLAAPERRHGALPAICRSSATAARIFSPSSDVVAIHANAHYTYIFDGNDKLFCPLAIGDVESRLDSDRFVRVHRSHIVNIDRVVGYKRSGDNEIGRDGEPAPLPGAGQPQPHRLAEIAGGRRLTAATPRLRLAAGTVLHRNRRRRLKRPCADRSVMLTQFVQQYAAVRAASRRFVHLREAGAPAVAAATHKPPISTLQKRYCAQVSTGCGDDPGPAGLRQGGCP